jgi:hypothetical protein
MKKTIASLALLASVSAHGIAPFGPGQKSAPRPQPAKKVCLGLVQHDDGSYQAGSCDRTEYNGMIGAELLENGCAEEQVAVVGISVRSCPTFVQL